MPPLHWFVAELDPKNAGYRVRTMPIVAELRAQGAAVELHAIADLPATLDELIASRSTVIVSKPADSMTLLCMAHLRAKGLAVVADLFDNYFSWSPAVFRRQLHWQWMDALQTASMVIVSTPFLGNVVRTLTDKPVVEVGDLVPEPERGVLDPSTLARKWVAGPVVDLLWFGIGGNPYYVSGLEDLVRLAPTLRRMAITTADRLSLRLTVCTNKVPSMDVAMQSLRQAGIDARYVEWSESACDQLLGNSHVVLLPTNLSGFSLSKTHNRCSDALSSGCLVLASPNGPYRGVGGAVFDDPDALAAALGRISPEAVSVAIRESYAALRLRNDLGADVRRLSQSLAFGSGAPARNARSVQPVLIASRTRAEIPKFSRKLAYLVAGLADGPLALNFDFRLEATAGRDEGVCVTLSERARTVLDAMLLKDIDADVQDYDGKSDVTLRGWRFTLQRGPHRLVVHAGLPQDSVKALIRAQSLPWRGNAALTSSWFDAHVDVLTRVLHGIGFDALRLAADEDGGWQSFAEAGHPDLAGIAVRLTSAWNRFRGREQLWGRPEGVKVC